MVAHTSLYAILEQGDELLVFGADILQRLARGETVVIACMGGRFDEQASSLFGNDTSCSWHEGNHAKPISAHEAGKARDREFFDSCQALGVRPRYIALPSLRLRDNTTPQQEAQLLSELCLAYDVDTLITHSPFENHNIQQSTLAQGALLARLEAPWPSLSFFANQACTRSDDAPNTLACTPHVAKGAYADRLALAAQSYRVWKPDVGRYAMLEHLCPKRIAAFLDDPVSWEQTGWETAVERMAVRPELDDIAHAQERAHQAQLRIEHLQNSTAWKVGRALTALPRAAKDRLTR